MKIFAKGLFIILTGVGLFSTCTNDVGLNDISNKMLVDQSLVLPIGKARISVEDILEQIADSTLYTEGREIYYQLSHKDSFYYHNTELFLNYTLTENINLPPKTVPEGSISTVYNNFWDFELNSDTDFERVDSAIINSMSFRCKLSVNNVPGATPENTKITISFGGKVKNNDGTDFSYTFIPNAFGVGKEINLNNIHLSFVDGNTVISGLPVSIGVEIQTASIVTSGSVTIELNMNNIDYKIAYGRYEPDITLAAKLMTVESDLSTEFKNGVLKFANPMINVTAISNVGTKIIFSIDYIRAYPKGEPNNYVEADFNGSPSIEVAIPKPASVGSFSETTFQEFNKDFGKTDLLFQDDQGHLPDIFEYQFNAKSEYAGTAASPDYLTPDAIIQVLANSTLPFYLKEGSWYEINDTIYDVSKEINDLFDKFEFEQAALNLLVENALPIQGECLLTFLDEQNNPITTDIIPNYEINPAKVFAKGHADEGKVETPNSQLITISLNKSQTETLKTTDKIKVTFKINAGDDKTPIHFTTDNYFDVNLGIYLKANHVIEI